MQKKKKIKNKCAPIFYKNVHFLGKTQNFQARCGKFSHDPIFFCCTQEGFKYDTKGATKRISKKVLFQATLVLVLPFCLPVHHNFIQKHHKKKKIAFWPDLTSAYYAKDTLTRTAKKNENTPTLPQLRPIKIF
jgi:hypothetical protein